MLSPLMYIMIFLEISIAVVTVLGSMLVISQFMKLKRMQDLYVFFVLVFGASTDLGMLYSQIAYSLQMPSAYVGFKVFLASIMMATICVWFHLSNIYGIKSRSFTCLQILGSIIAWYAIFHANVSLSINSGVIVPSGEGLYYIIGSAMVALSVAMESVFAVAFGIHSLHGKEAERFRISKIAGVLFFIFIASFFVYLITGKISFYFFMWLTAFFAMVFLFLFTMILEGSPLVRNPFDFFRTRILFKLVITLVLMIMISLEGMGIVSINIAKRSASESVLESYKKVAEDTISMIVSSSINISSEQGTLRSITSILERTKIGDRGSVFLISPSKNIYINRQKQWISLGTLQTSAIEKAFIGRQAGGEVNIFGEKVIAAYFPIKSIGWSIIVGQPIDFAYSRIRQMEGTLIIFILVWIVVTVGIGMVFARNLEGPIKILKKGIQKIGEGDLDHRITMDKIDEMAELANTLNMMTTELKESQASLIRSERLASLGYMAAGMAHEIKNALVPLKTLTELLAVSGKDEAFIAKFNELVPKEIDRINRLSTDLLHYSRPAEPVFEYLDVNDVVSEVAKFLEVQAKKRNILISESLSKVAEVKADKQKLIEVFTNLILNAIEAMTGGNITLSTFEKDDKVVVEIADNGPGIPEENLKRIFVPFFTTKKEGTGMGLAITQRIVADHGGTIDLQSTHGLGTRFFLSFPKKS